MKKEESIMKKFIKTEKNKRKKIKIVRQEYLF